MKKGLKIAIAMTFAVTIILSCGLLVNAGEITKITEGVVGGAIYVDSSTNTLVDCDDSVTSVVIPNGVTRIGWSAFNECELLTSVTIPNSVTSIDDYAFYSCTSLESITVDIDNQVFSSKNGILYNKGKTILFVCPEGKTVADSIPNSVIRIYDQAFCHCTLLTSVTIPNSVTSIGLSAFSQCTSLTSVTIPNSVTSIGDYAFSSCRSLENIIIPNNVNSIGKYAFYQCTSLTNVTIPNSVTNIGDAAFSHCESLENVTIPNSVTNIGDYAFYTCESLENVTIPNSVTRIGFKSFTWCTSLISVTIPNSVTSIGDSAFFNCESLESVIIPRSVIGIGWHSFGGCDNLTIYGYSGSYAEYYAYEVSIPFVAIGSVYKDVKDVPVGLEEGVFQLGLFEDAGGVVSDSLLATVYPPDYKLKFPLINTTIQKETNHDGTYAIKAVIGGNKNIILNSDKSYKEFKEDIDKAEKNYKEYSTRLQKWGEVGNGFTVTNEFKPKIEVLGYYEATVDEQGIIISDEGGIIVKASGKHKYAHQFIAPAVPIPFYIELGAGFEANAKLGIKKLIDSTPNLNGKFSIKPGITAGIGIGICELATYGIHGNAEVDAQIIPATKGEFSADIYLKCEIAFLVDYEKTVILGEPIELWNTLDDGPYGGGGGGSRSSRKIAQSQPAGKMTLADRSYQEKTSAWNGGQRTGKRTFAAAGDNQKTQARALQEYIMPNTIPSINSVNSKQVMVFQSNDKDRTSGNNVVLKYSVYENGKWSEPKGVMDDGTLDTFADCKVINNKLYVAWQKLNKKIVTTDINAICNEAAKSSEIYVAEFDSVKNEFGKTWRVTNNNYLDGIPSLVDCAGKPGVVWMRNKANTLIDTNGEKEICSSVYSGSSWLAENSTGKITGTISELEGLYENGKIAAYFTVSNSDNSEQKLLKAVSGKVSEISSKKENSFSNISADTNRINVVSDGIIESYAIDGTTATISAGEESVIGANVKHAKVGDKEALVWMSNEDQGCCFYSSVKVDGGYSKPVEIFRDENNIGQMFDATLNSDGSWNLVYTGLDMKNPTKTSLFYVIKDEEPKLELNDIVLNENNLKDGSQPFAYSVTNNGEVAVKNFELTVRNGKDVLLQKTVKCDIEPGETAYYEDAFACTEYTGLDSITVTAVAEDQTDLDNTEQQTEACYKDIDVSVSKQVTGNSIRFTAKITNNGMIATDGTISMFRDTNKHDLLEKKDFESIAPGESTRVTFEYGVNDFVLDNRDSIVCSIVADSGSKESNIDNSEYFGITYLWEFSDEVQTEIKQNAHTHTMIKTDAVAATCTKTGNIEYWTCSDCKKHYLDEYGDGELGEGEWETAALGHDFSNTAVDDKYLMTPMGCESRAVYYKSCTMCGLSSNDPQETFLYGMPQGHIWSDNPIIDENGLVTYKCENCDEIKYGNLDIIHGDIIITDELFTAGFKTSASVKEELETVVKSELKDNSATVQSFDISEKNGKKLSGGKITIVIPYSWITALPQNVSVDDLKNIDFVVAHMIDAGEKAGDVEILDYTLTETGLEVSVTSLSPFAIGMVNKESVAGDVNGDYELTSEDVTELCELLATNDLGEKPLNVADINKDGKIDVNDAIDLRNAIS